MLIEIEMLITDAPLHLQVDTLEEETTTMIANMTEGEEEIVEIPEELLHRMMVEERTTMVHQLDVRLVLAIRSTLETCHLTPPPTTSNGCIPSLGTSSTALSVLTKTREEAAVLDLSLTSMQMICMLLSVLQTAGKYLGVW